MSTLTRRGLLATLPPAALAAALPAAAQPTANQATATYTPPASDLFLVIAGEGPRLKASVLSDLHEHP